MVVQRCPCSRAKTRQSNCYYTGERPRRLCNEEVSRQSYIRISGDLFRCPRCKNRVRLRYNNPMFLLDGSYNQPLVVVEEAVLVHGI